MASSRRYFAVIEARATGRWRSSALEQRRQEASSRETQLKRDLERTRVELEGAESCCGSAGIYSVLRPSDSLEVLEPKLEALRRSGARTLVTANPGCHQQWQVGVRRAGLDVEVVHLAEALDRALDG